MKRGLAALVLASAALQGCAPADAAPPAAATITFRYSRFVPATISVPAGVPVTITLRNDDPIDHEWIVGPPEVHEGHRIGMEPSHEHRATEVTVPAFSSRATTVTLEPGTYLFICHLPGHETYGMTGWLRAWKR